MTDYFPANVRKIAKSDDKYADLERKVGGLESQVKNWIESRKGKDEEFVKNLRMINMRIDLLNNKVEKLEFITKELKGEIFSLKGSVSGAKKTTSSPPPQAKITAPVQKKA